MNIALPLGFGLAFVGTIPMSGPVAVLFMARALRKEPVPALLVAFGGSLVEAGYAFGIAFFLPQLLGRTRGMVLASLALGCVIVTALGCLLLLKPALIQSAAQASPRRGFVRGALSSLLNPTLIATWTVAVTTLYANGWLSARLGSAFSFALGVCVGSFAWFAIALLAIRALHHHVTPSLQTKVLRAMAGLLILAGIVLGVRFVVELTSHHEPRPQPGIERAGRILSHGLRTNDE